MSVSSSMLDTGRLLHQGLPDVRGDDVGVVLYLIGAALGEHPSLGEAVDVAAKAGDEWHVVLDDQDRQVELCTELGQALGKLFGLLRTDARERLVEHQELRSRRDRGRDLCE